MNYVYLFDTLIVAQIQYFVFNVLRQKCREKLGLITNQIYFKCQQKSLIFAQCALYCVEMASLGYDKQFRFARQSEHITNFVHLQNYKLSWVYFVRFLICRYITLKINENPTKRRWGK